MFGGVFFALVSLTSCDKYLNQGMKNTLQAVFLYANFTSTFVSSKYQQINQNQTHENRSYLPHFRSKNR
jgi:hypothetical protein